MSHEMTKNNGASKLAEPEVLVDAKPVPVNQVGLERSVGLEPLIRRNVVEALQRVLADEVALYLKTRNFHWNVEGPSFYQLHTLFERLYGELDVMIDDVAERIRALGGYAAGSMQEYAKLTRIGEVTGGRRGDKDARMETLLLRDHEQMIGELRTCIDSFQGWGDAGSQDFVTGLLRQHEKTAWMLRSLISRDS